MVLTKKMHQKNVIYIIIDIFLDKGFRHEPHFSGCHDLMQKAMNINDVALVCIKKKRL